MTEIRRGADPEYAANYAAAAEWRDTSLLTGASLFDPTRTVWVGSVADELNRRFVEGADEGSGTFVEKLTDQIRGSGQDACLLMAELVFVHLLPLSNVTLETKLRNINQIGSWAPAPFEVPEAFHEALGRGVFNGGAGFNTRRPNHLRFLVRFVRRWSAIDSSAERERLIGDPWAFKQLLHELPLDGATSQRNALLLMLFPATFEDISAREHKKRIAAAFPDLAGDSTDIDRQILAIREAKTAEFGTDFSWYAPDIRAVWDTKAPRSPLPAGPRTAAEALSAIFPDESDRAAFASATSEAILAADEVNQHSWSISFRESGLYLNVGPNRTLSARRDGVGLAAAGDSRQALAEAVRAGGIEAEVGEPYAFPGKTHFVRFSAKDATAGLTALRSSFLDAVRATAVHNTNYWRSHSPEALATIADLAGVELPVFPDRGEEVPGDQRAWIVRVKRDGKSEVAEVVAQGEAKVFWDIDVPPGSSVDVVKAALRADDPELSINAVGTQAGTLHRFITRIQPGDVVLSPDGSDLHLGLVASDAEYHPEAQEWTRLVDWVNAAEPIDRGDVSPALYSRLRSLLTVTEITELLPELVGLIDAADHEVAGPDIPPGPHAEPVLSPIDDDLAKDWMLDREWLEEIVDLLRRKKQVVFYGPPGTGKTYLAQKLADHLTGEGGSYKMVQFHPSYSYEDFVEGFRPQVDLGGNLTYELTPGPLKLLADAARENPAEPYFLLIDEINRGNLAKVFGELYYLLEYREQSLVLQYGSSEEDEFSLPGNLYLIGTMNTADRSIALVDAALRRRFFFVEFSPTKPPISELLPEWLRQNSHSSEPAELLAELNGRLDDDDYAIGPSYLMSDDAASQAGLDRIWTYSIVPLLVEHFYGQPGATERFALQVLQRAIRGRTQTSEGEGITDPNVESATSEGAGADGDQS